MLRARLTKMPKGKFTSMLRFADAAQFGRALHIKDAYADI
jgi:hypothetical protein